MINKPDKSIFEKIKEYKINYAHHCSDLYVPCNSITEKLINSYEFKDNVRKFYSHSDNKYWYNIPFAYDLYWKEKQNEK